MATRRRLYFMAKSELFRNRFLGFLLSAAGAFSVRRGEPDRKSISRAMDLLAKGEAVGIFPEGTRSWTGKFRRAEPGVGLLILRSDAPVVPAYMEGPYRFRRPVRLVIGRPFHIDAGVDGARTGAQKRQAAADAVMAEIAALGGRAGDYAAIVAAARPERPAATSDAAVSSGQE